ncbi:MAG: LytTR family DNA-binding domain-containing protein [Eubacteriales bacterium]|nr:LytTR family DNA-binding domain-containing protein [Eubacteriales bacterium]
MFNIAILDDEETCLVKIKEITKEYFRGKGIIYETKTYKNAEWFLSGLREEAFDLYILDVEMPGMNGIQVAKEIRKLYPEPVIIFVTNYIDYAVEAYEVNTYRYIPKMVCDKKLPESYDALLPEIMEKEEYYYVIEKKKEIEKIACSDIYYIKREGNNSVFVHREGKSKQKIPLFIVLDKLNSRGFYQIDKGYIVNLRHVMKITGYDVYMRNGTILVMRESRLPGLKCAMLDFWG